MLAGDNPSKYQKHIMCKYANCQYSAPYNLQRNQAKLDPSKEMSSTVIYDDKNR